MTVASDLAFAPAPPEPPPPSPAFTYALSEIYDELVAMGPERLVPLNVDAARVVTIVVGAAADIEVFRPRMVARFGEEGAKHCDRLVQLARALGQADAHHRAVGTDDRLPKLLQAGMQGRSFLRATIELLVTRNVVSPKVVPALRGSNRPRSVGFDLLDLVAFLSAVGPDAERFAACTQADLDRNESLANELVTTAAERAQPGRSETADLRQRAYSLLYESYDEVRAMLTYLRWREGDADEIAPPLSGGRQRRKPAVVADDAEPTT